MSQGLTSWTTKARMVNSCGRFQHVATGLWKAELNQAEMTSDSPEQVLLNAFKKYQSSFFYVLYLVLAIDVFYLLYFTDMLNIGDYK